MGTNEIESEDDNLRWVIVSELLLTTGGQMSTGPLGLGRLTVRSDDKLVVVRRHTPIPSNCTGRLYGSSEDACWVLIQRNIKLIE